MLHPAVPLVLPCAAKNGLRLDALNGPELWHAFATLPLPLCVVASCGVSSKCGSSSFAQRIFAAASQPAVPGGAPSLAFAGSADPLTSNRGVSVAALPKPGGEGTLVLLDVESVDGIAANKSAVLAVALASAVVLHCRECDDVLSVAASMHVAWAQPGPPARSQQPVVTLLQHDCDGDADARDEKAIALRESVGPPLDVGDDDTREVLARRFRRAFRPVPATNKRCRAVAAPRPGSADFESVMAATAAAVLADATPLLIDGSPVCGARFLELCVAVGASLNTGCAICSDFDAQAVTRQNGILRNFATQIATAIEAAVDTAEPPLTLEQVDDAVAQLAAGKVGATALAMLGTLPSAAATAKLAAEAMSVATRARERTLERCRAFANEALRSEIDAAAVAVTTIMATIATAVDGMATATDAIVLATRTASESLRARLLTLPVEVQQETSLKFAESVATKAAQVVDAFAVAQANATQQAGLRAALEAESSRQRDSCAAKVRDMRDAAVEEQLAAARLQATMLRQYEAYAKDRALALERLKKDLRAQQGAADAQKRNDARRLNDARDDADKEIDQLLASARRTVAGSRLKRVAAHQRGMIDLERVVDKVLQRDRPADVDRSRDAILAAASAALRRYEGLCRLTAGSVAAHPPPHAASDESHREGDVFFTAADEQAPQGLPSSVDIVRGLHPRQVLLRHPDAPQGPRRAAFGIPPTDAESWDMARCLERAAASLADNLNVVNCFSPWAPILACRMVWLLDVPLDDEGAATQQKGGDETPCPAKTIGDSLEESCVRRIAAQAAAVRGERAGPDPEILLHAGAQGLIAAMPKARQVRCLGRCALDLLEVADEAACRLLEGDESLAMVDHASVVARVFLNAPFDDWYGGMIADVWRQDPAASRIGNLPAGFAAAARFALRRIAAATESETAEDWEHLLATVFGFAISASHGGLYPCSASARRGARFVEPLVDLATSVLAAPPRGVSAGILAACYGARLNRDLLLRDADAADARVAAPVHTVQVASRSLRTVVDLSDADLTRGAPVSPPVRDALKSFLAELQSLRR